MDISKLEAACCYYKILQVQVAANAAYLIFKEHV